MMNRRQLVHASAVGAALLGPGSRALRLGDCRASNKAGFVAGYSLHGLECHFEDHWGHRFSERHVEVQLVWLAA